MSNEKEIEKLLNKLSKEGVNYLLITATPEDDSVEVETNHNLEDGVDAAMFIDILDNFKSQLIEDLGDGDSDEDCDCDHDEDDENGEMGFNLRNN